MMTETTTRRRSRRVRPIPPVPVTEATPAPDQTGPVGKKLDVNSKLSHFFRENGWVKVEHVATHASYELDGVQVTARLKAHWTLHRADGSTAVGTGAVALEAALGA